ncbi:MAG: peptidylprolyl isomerase [Bacteroidia bacterium]|jgi:cyclophilin family peptidyl-prolyl cis-trans isomerase|nr:peptidylprolyl isomerase [Bacteroidia bacterium]
MKKFLLTTLLLGIVAASGFAQTVFTGKPMYQIVTKRAGNYLGTITVELFPAIAPLHTANFDSLVSTQFYDSTAFHRVIPGFMIQGGDPNSRSGPRSTWGYGDPSQPTVNAEFTAARHLRGILSAARDTSINSANSQFFICVAAASWLNNQYSVYGRVISGMDIVDTIVSEPRDALDNPFQKIEMFITYAGSNDTLATVPVPNLPANHSFATSPTRLLRWDAQPDGIIYHVQVSTDSTFATTYRSVDVGINQYTVTGLAAGNKYYWRVRSNNGGDTSAFSTVWDFSVSAVGMEDAAAVNPIRVMPNPGNGEFTFTGMPAQSTLSIFDIAGKEILRRTNSSGNTCLADLTQQAKGVYFYSVMDEEGNQFRGKIVLE